jgi:hypothetical protein
MCETIFSQRNYFMARFDACLVVLLVLGVLGVRGTGERCYSAVEYLRPLLYDHADLEDVLEIVRG